LEKINEASSESTMIKIVVTGAESTGKSTLAKAIATNLQVPLLEEYSREYISNLNRPYQFDDLVEIAKYQLAQEQLVSLTNNPCFICDTGLLVLKIWSEYKYGRLDLYIADEWTKYKCDLYILPHFDIPYEKDPLRENPNDRHTLFQLYKDTLEQHNLSYLVVNGNSSERSEQALKATKTLLLSET
jgi:nicotinamide riboside kinase